MRGAGAARARLLLLQNAPLLLFLVLVAVFASLSPNFLTPTNFLNVLTQSAHIAIIAIGRTFVLLIAGIDLSVGAKYEVYKLINRLAADGTGVLMISSEIEELIGMCDRILVMGHGEIRGSHERTGFDREEILRSAMWDGLKEAV